MSTRFPRPLVVAAVSLPLLGLAYGAGGPRPAPAPPVSAGELTLQLAAASLWHDRDLAHGPEDVARAERLRAGAPVAPLTKAGAPGERPVYRVPPLYATAAAPFVYSFGGRGAALWQMALFLAVFWTAWALWARSAAAGIVIAGFFFASGALVHVFVPGTAVPAMAAVFAALALARRAAAGAEGEAGGRRAPALAAAGGTALAAAAVAVPPAGLLAVGPLVELHRRRSALLAFAVALVGVWALLAWSERQMTGSWPTPAAAGAAVAAPEGATTADPGGGAPLRLRAAAEAAAGRYTGVLAYYPWALLAVGLWLAWGERRRGLATAGGLAAALVALAVAGGPPAPPGPAGFVVLYPAFLFLPGALGPLGERRGAGAMTAVAAVLPLAATALWVTPLVVRPELARSNDLPPPHRLLVPEVALAGPELGPPRAVRNWGERLWSVPADLFFVGERRPGGAWLRGDSAADLFVAAPEPIETLHLTLRAVAPHAVATVAGADGTTVVRFDSEGKRQGTPVAVTPWPLGRDPGHLLPGGHLYRLRIEVEGGGVPARLDPESGDPRYLGVLVEAGGAADPG